MIRKIILYIFMLFSITLSVYAENIQGIDVSNWQGYINFEQVRDAGIEIVYIKASQGSNIIDPYFETNYTNAKNAGLKVGLYHFLTATSTQEAITQAQFFSSVISQKQPDCKLAMDFEIFNGLSNEEINAISFTFLENVQNLTGKDMVVYSDAFNAANTFSSDLARQYPLWVAEYGSGPVNTGNWGSYIGYQYTDRGEIAGINGFVDRDEFTDAIFLSATDQINTEPPTNQTFTDYTIQCGDTLSGIAKKYHTTVSELVGTNNISNPHLIYTNNTLRINTTLSLDEIRDDRYETNHIVYTIKCGDTLTAISKKYGVSIESIVDLNNIQNPNIIYAGEKIRIDLQ